MSSDRSPDLERLIGRAVIDKKFRKQLIKNAAKAIEEAGFSITAEELAQVEAAAERRGKKDDQVDQELDAARASGWK